MIPQTKGKIFLADERGRHETTWFRSYHTFNFGNYYHVHKQPFGALYVLNEDTLGGGRRLTLQVEEDTDIFLLPTVGAVNWQHTAGAPVLTGAGQALCFSATSGDTFTVSNPYEDALVNFLQLWIKRPGTPGSDIPEACDFYLDQPKDRLLPLFDGRLFIGKFNGRAETVHTVAHPGHGIFVFVIEGAFEVQHRLMNARDGLALWDVREIELEALSNDAILLVANVPAL
ncbi:pirin family protein [Chitinophaga japonensis]|uniref:Quercetin 2,3-dioxygenase C-terminal cupin domain-containing protein n=1 Tax=Chitinophaga japonensis TaxID=104662 RepID=A0A562TBV5_CHIJA|nr:pirin family protein [Chitinophaga japonensis]TWI90999.1 hypothetical protein LX66_0360 [Chitinophaga japonensis]